MIIPNKPQISGKTMENSNDINVEKQGQKQTFPSLPFCVCASFPPLCHVCSLCPLCPLETQGHKWTQSDTNGHTWPQRTQVDACRGTCTVHMWHSNLWHWYQIHTQQSPWESLPRYYHGDFETPDKTDKNQVVFSRWSVVGMRCDVGGLGGPVLPVLSASPPAS